LGERPGAGVLGFCAGCHVRLGWAWVGVDGSSLGGLKHGSSEVFERGPKGGRPGFV